MVAAPVTGVGSPASPRRRFNSREVAVAAGVSQATVSNVLNRPGLVAPATFERVMEAIDSLDFVINRSAQTLRVGQGSALGIIVLDVANAFWGEVTRGVQDAAAEQGRLVIVCSSGESELKEEQLLRLLESHQVSDILVAPVVSGSPMMGRIKSRGTRLIFLDSVSKEGQFDAVAVDDVKGARLAAEHLLSVGHTQVAFVNGPRSISWCQNRAAGFLDTYHSAGGEVRELSVPTMTAREALKCVDDLLKLTPRVSAVFCANDMLALGVLQGLTRRGVKVPDDLSLVGYDDDDFAEVLSPALTTVRQDPYEIGRLAGEMALAGPEDGASGPSVVMLEPLLVTRDSVRRRS